MYGMGRRNKKELLYTRKLIKNRGECLLSMPMELASRLQMTTGDNVTWRIEKDGLIMEQGGHGPTVRTIRKRNNTTYAGVPIDLVRAVGMRIGTYIKVSLIQQDPWELLLEKAEDPPKTRYARRKEQKEVLDAKAYTEEARAENNALRKEIKYLESEIKKLTALTRDIKFAHYPDSVKYPKPGEAFSGEWWLTALDGYEKKIIELPGKDLPTFLRGYFGPAWWNNPYFIMHVIYFTYDAPGCTPNMELDLSMRLQYLMHGFDDEDPSTETYSRCYRWYDIYMEYAELGHNIRDIIEYIKRVKAGFNP